MNKTSCWTHRFGKTKSFSKLYQARLLKSFKELLLSEINIVTFWKSSSSNRSLFSTFKIHIYFEILTIHFLLYFRDFCIFDAFMFLFIFECLSFWLDLSWLKRQINFFAVLIIIIIIIIKTFSCIALFLKQWLQSILHKIKPKRQ